MKVQPGENGWPGIFIPGDDALALANMFEMAAKGLEKGNLPVDAIATMLRNNAAELRKCYVSRHPIPGHRLADAPSYPFI